MASKGTAPKPPTGVYLRGDVLWGRYKDADGKWKCVSLDLRKGQESEAAELLTAIKRRVAAGREIDQVLGAGRPSFRKFFAWWIERRKARKIRSWKDDESRIRVHVLDSLGSKNLDDITPLDLERVFQRMRDRGRAPKTVWNAYSSVRALFRDAVKKGFLRHSPCLLGQEELGAIVDKDPEWRETALYSREEIAALMFDPRIPIDRRVFYATTYFAGRRLGETAGLRVRQVDFDAQPLGALLFARSYADDPTKTKTTVRMPLHPTLATILRAWLDGGFEEMFGRPPEPDDFVIPRPPECRSKFGPCRDKNYVRKGLLKDLPALDLRHRRTHDLRRSFITHAQQDGGKAAVLQRLTHPSTKKSSAFAGYTEFSWEDYCEEVAKLHLDPPEPTDNRRLHVVGGDAVAGGPATRAPTSRPTLATLEKKPPFPGAWEWRWDE